MFAAAAHEGPWRARFSITELFYRKWRVTSFEKRCGPIKTELNLTGK